ncbi:hypothetical protein K1T71_013860 [Dendrolimus kikuchii]|uniref:Uncharacterized protein n=1 Tax=Dendrolimus kikuchii TaxID=765133 RepID=A0ACC1CFZ0_9NEOP|nr:hypothetical protein K1T71_013860 [Dendrolimus kikuchii]
MSIVAIQGVPAKWSYSKLILTLSKGSQEYHNDFEMLNFGPNLVRTEDIDDPRVFTKVAYIRLSETLDPVKVVETFNNAPNSASMTAFIPDHIPNLAPKKKLKFKRKNAAYFFPLVHREILIEMQSKYAGLYNLSMKTDHKLLKQLSIKLFERLKTVQKSLTKIEARCLEFSRSYRKTYPHFCDFQLILSTLHALQDACGVPRAQISEQLLKTQHYHPNMSGEISNGNIQIACKQYSEAVAKKMADHINSLNSEVNAADSEEEVARKKVRAELKKMAPFFEPMVQQISLKHFAPIKPRYIGISMYGEHFLPPKEVMWPFLRRFRVLQSHRSPWLYNLLHFNVPPQYYSALMAMDGTVINGAKLVIRARDIPKYKVPLSVLKRFTGKAGDEFYDICASNDALFDEDYSQNEPDVQTDDDEFDE